MGENTRIIDINGVTIVPINHCEKQFVNQKFCSQFSRQETIPAASDCSNSNEGLLRYRCKQCSLSFDTLHELDQHSALRCSKLICYICTAIFRRPDHLKRHVQNVHVKEKYSICPVCNLDCKKLEELLDHVEKEHDSSDVYICRDCEFKCHSYSELLQHEYNHAMTEQHVCPHCNKPFKRRDHMLRHIKSQHLNHHVTCPLCNQLYKRKDHLVRHVREKHKMGYLNGKLITASDML